MKKEELSPLQPIGVIIISILIIGILKIKC